MLNNYCLKLNNCVISEKWLEDCFLPRGESYLFLLLQFLWFRSPSCDRDSSQNKLAGSSNLKSLGNQGCNKTQVICPKATKLASPCFAQGPIIFNGPTIQISCELVLCKPSPQIPKCCLVLWASVGLSSACLFILEHRGSACIAWQRFSPLPSRKERTLSTSNYPASYLPYPTTHTYQIYHLTPACLAQGVAISSNYGPGKPELPYAVHHLISFFTHPDGDHL